MERPISTMTDEQFEEIRNSIAMAPINDLYKSLAALMFEVPFSAVTADQRREAKFLLFALKHDYMDQVQKSLMLMPKTVAPSGVTA